MPDLEPYYDRLLALLRIRLTIGLALFAGYVSLLSVAVQSAESTYLLAICAGIAAAGWALDDLLEGYYVVPLYYKLTSLEISSGEPEPLSLLLLGFGIRKESAVREVFQELSPGPPRRSEFETVYRKQGRFVRWLVYGAGILLPYALWRFVL